MKLNQFILAAVLFASVTATHSAQAWEWWDLCPSPIVWLGSYIRAKMPITNAKLNEFKQDQIASTDRHFDEITKRENLRQGATDAGFVKANDKHIVIEGKVDGIARKAENALNEVTVLRDTSLPNMEKALLEKMKELAVENELLKQQNAEQRQTIDELTVAQQKSEEQAQDLAKKLIVARHKLSVVKVKTQESTKQAQEHATRIAGISLQLKSLTGSESIIKQGLSQYMQNAMNPTMYSVSNTQKLH